MDVAQLVAIQSREKTVAGQPDEKIIARQTSERVAARQPSGKILDSRAASDLLLARAKIAATPMLHWGGPTADRYLRFVFANEPIPRLATISSRLRPAFES